MSEYTIEEIATYIDSEMANLETQYNEALINAHNAKVEGNIPYYHQTLAYKELLGRGMDKLYILRERITTHEEES